MLSHLYNLQDLQPTLHYVTLSDSSVVTVPVFNGKAVILSILHDHNQMNPSNFAPRYDIVTGTSTDPNNHHLNEIHTGMLWNTARDFYCQGTTNAFLLSLVCFYDKTHTDLYGSLSCAPFVMTFCWVTFLILHMDWVNQASKIHVTNCKMSIIVLNS
jgi:hypothetical protein